jgi:signal transduction histidine kinase/ligand-binding sensor domain-containing protein
LFIAAALPALASVAPTRPLSSFIHQSWQTAQGLPQNSVLAMAQTRDGYLWIGTEEGLVRFDGVRFTTFNARGSGLPSKIVTALLPIGDHDLWVGTNGGGLARFADGKFTPYTTRSGLPNNSILCLHLDRHGTLWAGTDGGGLVHLEKDRPGKSHFRVYSKADGLADNAVFSLSETSDGILWIGTHNGVNTFKAGNLSVPGIDAQLQNRYVRALLVDRSGAEWIGTEDGLYRWNGSALERFTKTNGLAADSIYSLLQDGAGSIWIGTAGAGLTRYAEGRFTDVQPGTLSGVAVWSLLEDAAGNLWAGTTGSGLHVFRQGSFTTLSMADGLPADAMLAVFQDRDGGIWLGSDHGLVNYRDGRVTSYSQANGLPDNLVFSVAQDRSGRIWASTRKGLSRLENGRFITYTAANGLANDFVVCLFVDHLGNLWMGSRGGLTRYDGNQFRTYTTHDGLPNDFVSAIDEAADGTLWVATGGGVSSLHNGHIATLTSRNGLSNDVVRAVYADPDGSIWFGTNGGGLSHLHNGVFSNITTENGLFDDSLFAILDDRAGHLWLTCNRGVFSVSKQQIELVARGAARTVTPAVYGTGDGLKSHECNGGFQPAAWRLADGRLAFPTMLGVSIADPMRLNQAAALPAIIERVVADGKDYVANKAMNAPPGRGDLQFEFSAPTFSGAETVQFRYMLEGFDKDWLDAGTRRSAYYTNIPHGEYRFRVRAGKGDNWKDAGAGVAITLEPHYYQTLPFYLLVGMAAVGLCGVVYSWRVNQLKRREQTLLELVDERTAALRESERQLRRSRDELEIRVHERTIELVRSNQALEAEIVVRRRTEDQLRVAKVVAEQASNAKSEFLANISHEIRTPINGILGMTEVTLSTELDTEQREYLDLVKLSADSLLRVVNSILDFSTMANEEVTLNNAPFPLPHVIQELVEPLAALAHEKGLSFACNTISLPETVVGDRGRLAKVLSNLLDNAVKFTERGGVTLSAGIDERTADSVALHFVIGDTGPGLAPDKQQLIFEPFTQGDNSSTRQHGGTGLGLTISSQIVALMGGRIWVESNLGEGSQFHVTTRFALTAEAEATDGESQPHDQNFRAVLAPS